MASTDVLGEVPLPKTVAELKEQDKALKRCTSCRSRQATHTVSLTLAAIGGNADFRMSRVPVCEACGSQVAGLARRALKA